MKNKAVSSSNKGFANWIEDFITGLANKEASVQPQEEKEEILAEINLNDLDKVVWKEETFGVHFDDLGASLINEFGNVVRTLQGAKTIDEVDKLLNGSEIVIATIEEEKEEEEDLKDELNKIADSLSEEETEEVEELSKEADMEEEDGDDAVIAAIAAGFEEMEATIASLNKRISSFEQEYARNPVVNQDEMASQILEEETKHFTETADETAKQVATENAVDFTTPAGRVELSTHTETSEIQNLVTETPLEETPTEEVAVEETTTEEVTEEAPTKEAQVEEVTEDEEDGVKVEKLAGAAEKIFQKGVCPETGEELVKSKAIGNFLGVYSNAGTEYAVDLSSGSIYKYLK